MTSDGQRAFIDGGPIAWNMTDGDIGCTKSPKRERPKKNSVPLENLTSKLSDSQSTCPAKCSKGPDLKSDLTDNKRSEFRLPMRKRAKHLPKCLLKHWVPKSSTQTFSALKSLNSTLLLTLFDAPVGNTKSSVWWWNMKEVMKNGTSSITENHVQKYKEKIYLHNSHTMFRCREDWEVFYSVYGKWYTMKMGYNIVRFTEHCEKCIIDVSKLIKRATILNDWFLKNVVKK